jgi:hypothetical protein
LTIRISTEAGETVTTIRIEGQLTSSSVPDVRAACESANPSLRLDLSGLRLADRDGMPALRSLSAAGSRLASLMVTLLLVAALPLVAGAHEPDKTAHGDLSGSPHAEHGSLSEVAHKLSDPTSNVWALFTEFDLSFSDGDVNTGDPKIGGDMNFQPILPIPLYGEGKDQWKIIARPSFPVIFSEPVPTGFNRFNHIGGLGDTILPLPVTPPAGNWILGLGPTFLFPTATNDDLGREQFAIGPTGIFGWKNKHTTVGIFPQYFFKIGSIDNQANKPDASFMNLLYFAYWNLPDAWQIGMNPVITYDNKATKGNKWNVPLGLLVTKTTAVGKRPVKFQFGFEYSVVSQDDFGKRFMIKFNVIPVIQGLVNKPIFGRN